MTSCIKGSHTAGNKVTTWLYIWWENFSKFIREIFSCILFHCKTGFTCNHGPVEVFSVQSTSLPDPKRRLSSIVRPQAIDSANKKVSAIFASDSSDKDQPSRGLYMKLSPEQMAQIARYLMDCHLVYSKCSFLCECSVCSVRVWVQHSVSHIWHPFITIH